MLAKNRYLDTTKLELREYQAKIAKECVAKNSLVVIPTGLGKTIIAILIVGERLKQVPKNGKIIVMAPTRPLLRQHFKSFQHFLDLPKTEFIILTGKTTPEKRPELFEKHRILFFTPQTLRNDIAKHQYSLKDVAVMIFDEAHHTSGDYPYTLLADEYVIQNPDGNILALTASPGSSKKDIVQLCSNLHIPFENIHIRTREDSDVQDYIKAMDIYKIGVKFTPLMDSIYTLLHQALEDRLQVLSRYDLVGPKKTSKPLFKSVIRKDLLTLQKELAQKIREEGQGAKKYFYTSISVNAQALILYHMISLVEQQGLDVLMEYLEKLNNEIKKKDCSKAKRTLARDARIRKIYMKLKQIITTSQDDHPLIHPKFEKLIHVMEDELDYKPDSKILVFIKLRDSVRLITKALSEIDGFRPHKFVGQSKKSQKDKGLSQKEQIAILDQFKEGKYNILVSTNVGEEGLDIAECDMVVFYDVVASEIRLIQRRGRTARHREGKVVILYCKDTNDEIYLRIALNKLRKMNVNLKSKSQLKYFYELEMQKDTRRCSQEKFSSSEKVKDVGEEIAINENKKRRNIMEGSEKTENFNIILSQELDMGFGLRSALTKKEINFTVAELDKVDIILHEKIALKVIEIEDYKNKGKRVELEMNIEKLKSNFELLILIFNFVDYQFRQQYANETYLLKNSALQFGKKHNIQVINIQNLEELHFIIYNLYKHQTD